MSVKTTTPTGTTSTGLDIVDRLRIALDCRAGQGLSTQLFADAIAEIVRLRSASAPAKGVASVPAPPVEVLVDVEQVAAILELGSTQVYMRTVRDLGFPRPVHLTGDGPKWRRSDIEAWATSQAA